MTAPAIDSDVDHLEDLRPACGHPRHDGGQRPTATRWVDQHGCDELLLCSPCVGKLRRKFAEIVADGYLVVCKFCNREIASFESSFTVRPL